MNITKVTIKNLYGITERQLDGKSIEITGTNGIGKTSVIDAIRYALTNNSNRDIIVRKSAEEGEILLETDTNLVIDRKKRLGQADYKSIKENNKDVPRPESFLSEIFTPLQLNPVAFTQMSKQEQNRIILNLIEFDWDINWIQEQFGEIPKGINYDQNILQVLADIQAKDSPYYKQREDVNRDIRNKQVFITDIAKDIPANYDFKKWDEYETGPKYSELSKIKETNDLIQRASKYKEDYNSKVEAINNTCELTIKNENESIDLKIEEQKRIILEAQQKIELLNKDKEKIVEVANLTKEKELAKLEEGINTAEKYLALSIIDEKPLEEEINFAEAMKKHLNEYRRMNTMRSELESLQSESNELTRKIDLARSLPGDILKTAKLPISGLTVEDGIPLINGLPINALSEGEQLDLCVDVAIGKPNVLKLILIDGAEKLSDINRNNLYQKCKEKGLQFIATRTTNDNELIITEL